MNHLVLRAAWPIEGGDPAPRCRGELVFDEDSDHMWEGIPCHTARCAGCGHMFRISHGVRPEGRRLAMVITPREAVKVVVATHQTQGQRSNDFANVPEGELLTFGSQCDGGFIDDACGCKRAMCGVHCRTAITTGKIVMWIGGRDAVSSLVRESLENGGWLKLMDPLEAAAWITSDVEALLEAVDAFELGMIIEFRGDTWQTRDPRGAMGCLDHKP